VLFYGRDDLVKDIVDTLLLPHKTHIALIGPGGIGKTTMSKALLNEEHIAAMFIPRLFITYDNVDYSLMTYDTFLSRIAETIKSPSSTRISILNRIKSFSTALLVIDNAEAFVEAGHEGFREILQMLDEMGTLCRIIFTTRNTDTVPANLRWKRIYVSELDDQAAVDAFAFIYDLEPVDAATKSIILELDCHPLSINILANLAVFNRWSLVQLEENWTRQSKSTILETSKDRYHSVGTAIELSISCSAFKETRTEVVKLLRSLAFLPQGIHRRDLKGVLQDDSAISVADSLCRCSLAFWRDGRLTVLSPIRMYIMQQYNTGLQYDDELLAGIRNHYYSQVNWKFGHCALYEHANLERVLHFDLSQSFVRYETMKHATGFITELYNHNPQPTGLWSLLKNAKPGIAIDTRGTFDREKASAMIWMSTLYSDMNHNRTSLEMIEAAEELCRKAKGVETALAECLRERAHYYGVLGRIAESQTYLWESHAICEELEDREGEALGDLLLSHCALRRGDFPGARELLTISADSFDPRNQAWAHALLQKARIEMNQWSRDQRRHHYSGNTTMSDEDCRGARWHLEMSNLNADGEAKAGNHSTAQALLSEVAAIVIFPGKVGFLEFLTALRGEAYYAARAGDIVNARSRAARALALASEGFSNDSYRKSLLMCGYIELFAHDYSRAGEFLHSALATADVENLALTAMVSRALGEMATLEENGDDAERHFSEIISTCETMGIPARCLYIWEYHWYTLPDDSFPAWSSYLELQQGRCDMSQ